MADENAKEKQEESTSRRNASKTRLFVFLRFQSRSRTEACKVLLFVIVLADAFPLVSDVFPSFFLSSFRFFYLSVNLHWKSASVGSSVTDLQTASKWRSLPPSSQPRLPACLPSSRPVLTSKSQGNKEKNKITRLILAYTSLVSFRAFFLILFAFVAELGDVASAAVPLCILLEPRPLVKLLGPKKSRLRLTVCTFLKGHFGFETSALQKCERKECSSFRKWALTMAVV